MILVASSASDAMLVHHAEAADDAHREQDDGADDPAACEGPPHVPGAAVRAGHVDHRGHDDDMA